MRSRLAPLLAVLLLLAGCVSSAPPPAATSEQFIIHNEGRFSGSQVYRVIQQLNVGLDGIRAEGLPVRDGVFPVAVHVKAGRGISRTAHGRGPIILFHTARKASPIIHELVHMLVGYKAYLSHWSPEGLASYLQDKYGEDRAFPTEKMAHELVRVILEKGRLLPMARVMRDRKRQDVFGMASTFNRWLAYTQSASFVSYLMQTYGTAKFIAVYNKPYEITPFRRVYGKTARQLVGEWRQFLTARTQPLDQARQRYAFRQRNLKP